MKRSDVCSTAAPFGLGSSGRPEQAVWGGGGYAWRDPEGNAWDAASAGGSQLDDGGGVTVP
jgi:hypothetical protein